MLSMHSVCLVTWGIASKKPSRLRLLRYSRGGMLSPLLPWPAASYYAANIAIWRRRHYSITLYYSGLFYWYIIAIMPLNTVAMPGHWCLIIFASWDVITAIRPPIRYQPHRSDKPLIICHYAAVISISYLRCHCYAHFIRATLLLPYCRRSLAEYVIHYFIIPYYAAP
jgi:hypothetical protein